MVMPIQRHTLGQIAPGATRDTRAPIADRDPTAIVSHEKFLVP